MSKQTSRITTTRIVKFARKNPLILVCAVFVACLIATLLLKTALPVGFDYRQKNQSINKQYTIEITQKLRPIDVSAIKIKPSIDGNWQFKRGTLFANDELSFKPKSYFRADTKYTVSIPESKRLIIGNTQAQSISFQTESAPKLLPKTGLTELDDNQVVAADYSFSTKLSAPGKGLRDLELQTEPKLQLTRKIANDQQTYSWQSESLLPQGKTVKLTVYDHQNDEILTKKTVKIASEPSVKDPVKKTYFTPDDKAVIVFSQPIEDAGQKNIKFDLAGEGDWKNPTTYVFSPKEGSIKPGQTYSYQITKGLRSKDGGILTKTLDYQFASTGQVAVVDSSPWGKELAQGRQTISLTFNQAVDRSSAQKRFAISSGKVESFSWQGNTLRIVVTGLGYQRTVNASVGPGVANAGFGLPSNQTFGVSFTTEYRQKRLGVPYYMQQHSATCTAATLRMALAYRGIQTDEMSIVSKMGYRPTKMNKSTKPATWDDPALMFVGSVDGSIKNGTGAGPDAPPVAKAARAYGRSATAVTGASPAWIAQQIYNGNPVIMFGAFSNSGFASWKTPSGTITKMNLTSHVVTVTGVVGEPGSPIGFWINDPLAGSPAYWTASQVAANLARDVAQQAVVVY